MNVQIFTLKFGCDCQKRIESYQDLVDLLEQESRRHDLGQTVQIPLLTASGNIVDRLPSAFDDSLYWWDRSERRPADLWQLLQNFLLIRLAEHHEKPYLPADEDLGRVPGNYPHSEF